MSREFNALSYYCTSQLTADDDDAVEQSDDALTPVQLTISERLQQQDHNQPTAGDDQIVTVGSDDSDADDVDICIGNRQQTPVIDSTDQRPLAFCAAMNARSITVNGGLGYHQLPAVC